LHRQLSREDSLEAKGGGTPEEKEVEENLENIDDNFIPQTSYYYIDIISKNNLK